MAKAAKKSSASSSSTRSKAARSRRKQPWDKANPRKRAGKSSHHLTPSQEAAAKAMAKRAGRPYPNLVDNMRAAKKAKKSSKKSTTQSSKSTKTKSAKDQVGQAPDGQDDETDRLAQDGKEDLGRAQEAGEVCLCWPGDKALRAREGSARRTDRSGAAGFCRTRWITPRAGRP
ncbi:hypothetical protein [Rhodopseudomonas sp. B29]|uniref:hypothetical protein n=1 Tax=Rhodopseudomonas sp. B29 TaxID=95607 RepID=UPI0005938C12|nr:hypothetical protein [Rhodopseudomonas sp. B29]